MTVSYDLDAEYLLYIKVKDIRGQTLASSGGRVPPDSKIMDT
jgi:hypothetical protein